MKKKFLSFYHKVSWINVKLSFSAMLLFFTFVFVQAVAGVPVFNISTMDKVVNVSPGDTANVLYTIRNNSGLNIADAEYIPSYFTSISSFSNCPTNLLKDETCNLVLTLHAPQSMGSIFLIPFRVCGFSGQMCGIADKNNHIRVNVTQTAEGHFVFRQSSTDITTLDLAPGATGSVILHNSGGSTISGYSLNIPAAVSGYFSGDCTTVTSLAAGVSCNLAYTIPSTPVTGMYSLTASGTNADNSPHVLSVTIATQGHFVFRQGATDVTTLDLTPGAIGSVTLHNTGGSTISGYSLNIPAAVSGYFSGDCTTVTSLAAGASCNLAYTIPSTPVTGMHSLTVSGTNADNSPHVLSVAIATQGHFVFRQGATRIQVANAICTQNIPIL